MKSKRKATLYLDYDKVYTFLFQKNMCKDKIVILNTQIPVGLKGMQDESFDFQVEMSQILTKTNVDTEDLPVAVVMIDKNDELLEASENYYKLMHAADSKEKNEDNLLSRKDR